MNSTTPQIYSFGAHIFSLIWQSISSKMKLGEKSHLKIEVKRDYIEKHHQLKVFIIIIKCNLSKTTISTLYLLSQHYMVAGVGR